MTYKATPTPMIGTASTRPRIMNSWVRSVGQQLGLARNALHELAAKQAHADGGAHGAQADHQSGADVQKNLHLHGFCDS